MKGLIVGASLLLSSFLAGQELPACNQRECKHVAADEFVSAVLAECGVGLEIRTGVVTYTPKDGKCPVYIISTPPHTERDLSHLKPDAHAVDGGVCEVVKQQYACFACGFLWLSSCCERDGEPLVVNVLKNCDQAACRPGVAQ